MFKHSKLRLILVLMGFLILFSCRKKENYPDTPHIEFKSFSKIQNATIYDDKGIVTLSFTDGNGDIGLAMGDTFSPYSPGSPYYYNFFIQYFERQMGVWTKVEPPLPFNARIPLINPSGKEMPLSGDLQMEIYINNPLSTYDTIRFELYILDRALNQSNSITTPEIIVKKH